MPCANVLKKNKRKVERFGGTGKIELMAAAEDLQVFRCLVQTKLRFS
jgi:hypothetical protein